MEMTDSETSKPRILIVDDDEIVLGAVLSSIEDMFEIRGTESPEEALRILETDAFEILVSDLMMREMYGLDLIKAAREIRPDIAVIVITGYASKEVAVKSLREGVHDFLEKPLTPDMIIRSVNGVWERLKIELENRRLMEELSRTNERLLAEAEDRKRAEHDKAKLETQLLQARKMEAIGVLAGGIAHEFNNILTPISGYAAMTLEDLSGNSEAGKYLGEILKASERAAELIRQILTFSRQADLKMSPLKIQFVLGEALKLLKSTLPATIEIVDKADRNCGYVLADSTQIYQVVMNLCTNAFHAMWETGGTLEVDLTEIQVMHAGIPPYPGMKPGKYVALTVGDTGTGMDGGIVDRIFEPYFTTKEEGKGTGMGLAIVHGIVTNHNGYITVDSEPGKGSAFHVWLPLIESLPKAAKKIAETLVPRGDEHILFVDDQEPIIKMAKKMLGKLGYKTTARQSSLEALHTFQTWPEQFDLVITDMTMPDMTGDILAKKVKGIKPDMPVILCTGFSDRINREKAKAIGIAEFVMKPFIRDKLARIIREVLDRD